MYLVGLASDHAGFALKQFVKDYLSKKNIKFKDYGCFNEDSCDYPDFGHALAEGMEKNECAIGIAICGTGEGISMTLNKHQLIRAALCWMPEIAQMARLHNDANVLVMPGRHLTTKEAEAIMDVFFATDFEGGRHVRRINKIPLHNGVCLHNS